MALQEFAKLLQHLLQTSAREQQMMRFILSPLIFYFTAHETTALVVVK